MPSFDVVSDLDMMEVENAINQAQKEIASRFDFKGGKSEITLEKEAKKENTGKAMRVFVQAPGGVPILHDPTRIAFFVFSGLSCVLRVPGFTRGSVRSCLRA